MRVPISIAVLLLLCGSLLACQNQTDSAFTISGQVFEGEPLAQAQVTLVDARGQRLQARTDAQGIYRINADYLQAPLLLSVVSHGRDAKDCNDNSKLRPICLAAVLDKLAAQQTAHINPLTDQLVSDVAVAQGYIGPQAWVDAASLKAFKSGDLAQARHRQQQAFAQALQQAGITNPANFDPATYPLQQNPVLMEVLGLLHHNRNYDNNTGTTGHTTLSDILFRPLTGLMPNGAYETFDLERARRDQQNIQQARTRIFIVGDSTSAVYEELRYPRMGWGQAQFKPDSGIQVIVGSRAGRSSRDFYHGRWFAQMEPLIQAGDYVFINHGHNDQNCDSNRPLRGTADVKNLCTYPNNAQGQVQHPEGQPELSFQHSLQRYISIAQAKGAIPILFTPSARIKNARGEQTTPVVHSHWIKAAPGKAYLFTGDYTQTIHDLARQQQLPLIDLAARSIEFANQAGEPGWKNYWLVVDPSINPFYANSAPGSPQAPDGTHFQKNGAEAMAKLVAQEIKQQPELQALAQWLRD